MERLCSIKAMSELSSKVEECLKGQRAIGQQFISFAREFPITKGDWPY